MPLRDITRAHVHELLDTLVAKGMTTGVNRVQAVISRLFTVALDRSLVDAHPAARMIKRFHEPLPPYPDPRHREDLCLVLGEQHHRTTPARATHPQWLVIPERGSTSAW